MSAAELQKRINAALDLARIFGQFDGAHHKSWVIDQMVRALTSDDYEQWVKGATTDQQGNYHPYDWDTGIAP